MFTGLVEAVGEIAAVDAGPRSSRVRVRAPSLVDGLAVGDSVALDGCCVTVTSCTDDGFTLDLMAATMDATTLSSLAPGRPVNLERAVALGARIGGHLVQGHVDGIGRIVGVEDEPGTRWLDVAVPEGLGRYLVDKGSVTIDGVSLTVAASTVDGVRVGLIPHTRAVTTLGRLTVGDAVNLEVDLIAKHVERLLAASGTLPGRATTPTWPVADGSGSGLPPTGGQEA
jgi:riboflavin synthase